MLAGELTITVDGTPGELAAGDTIAIPAGVERQGHARTAARLIVCGSGDAIVTVPGEEAPRGTPAWIA
ncbi:MAG TPA: cupin domain-containing protein [Solirubrobacterales bacterium]|nr:cupin domain-containing protein [Solirubrobacterales bacterium]